MVQPPAHLEERVIVLAPTARDRDVTAMLFSGAGIPFHSAKTMDELIAAAEEGAGAILLTDDVLAAPESAQLIALLQKQPEWSDLPLIVLLRGGEIAEAVRLPLDALSNVVLVERPVPVRSMLSAVEAAVRARRRQYQIRDQIDQIHRLLASERSARAAAEHASRAKDEFVATLSHELRTPMAAVLGWAQLLRRAPGDAQTTAHGLEVIERNARMQSKLIEDLLEMSRILTGKIRLDVKPVDLAPIVDAAVDSVRHSIEAKNLSFSKHVDEVGRIRGDAERLQQVLWNLLSNAVKFTPTSGQIELRVHRAGDGVHITVRDSGLGIEPEFLPHVFERFRQAESPSTRRTGGLGLGLGIVKHLVELHGGTVRAASEGAGRGATFTVELPLLPIREQPTNNGSAHSAAARKQRDLRGIRVLLIDDDRDVREIVSIMLAERHAEVATAASASEALDQIRHRPPNVIICDLAMPGMDGFEFMRRLREEHPTRHLPAAALTAFADERHRERARTAGFQAHLTKPINDRQLAATIAKLAEQRS